MKLFELLSEAPLPPDWEPSVYSGTNPKRKYKEMIDYATERANKLGSGSSRVAFEVEYEGRPTVLKIAKNKKGMAQNEVEAELLRDYYLNGMGVTVKMIDYDETGDQPSWIHMEKAEKMPRNWMKKFSGVDLHTLMEFCYKYNNDGKYYNSDLRKRVEEQIKDDEEVQEFVDTMKELFGNYSQIQWVDLGREANWGLYEGNPVILDIGYTDDIRKLYWGN